MIKLKSIIRIASLVFAASVVYQFTDKIPVYYAETAALYKKEIHLWPKPSIDRGALWKEFEAIDWDTAYYSVQEISEVQLGKALFFDPKLSADT